MNFISLAYHRIAAHPGAPTDHLTVDRPCFQAQLRWLARRGYKGVAMKEALTGTGGRRPIALTFDDGTGDFLTTAWPLLSELGFSATVFVSVGLVGTPSYLTWRELSALNAAGLEIGGHGVLHQSLVEMPARRMAEEFRETAAQLKSRLGLSQPGFAYPYGLCSADVIAMAKKAGFCWAVTTRGGRNTAVTPRYQLRRTLIFRNDCTFWGRFRWPLKVRRGYAQCVEWRMDIRRIK